MNKCRFCGIKWGYHAKRCVFQAHLAKWQSIWDGSAKMINTITVDFAKKDEVMGIIKQLKEKK